MSRQDQQRTQHRVPLWGILLLFLGIVFLLQTLDIIPWALWGTLWRFWPVLIIAIGLNIMLSRFNSLLVGIVILALFFTSFGIAMWQYERTPGIVTRSYSEPLAGLERAQIEIDFDGGSISLSSLAHSSPNFAEIESEARNTKDGVEVQFNRQGSEGTLELSTEGVNRLLWIEPWIDCNVILTPNIPLTITVNSAASDIELDLSRLLVTQILLNIDAANSDIKAPSSATTTYIQIDAAASNVNVLIPDDVAARIEADTSLCAFDVDESRFPKAGSYYVSNGFEDTANRVALKINCDVSRIQVN